jgi:hypothetical protein
VRTKLKPVSAAARLWLSIGLPLMAAGWLWPLMAAAADDSTVYARVVVDVASVRAGPSASYRSVYTAHRDDVFPVRARASNDYWFRIELPDGTQGFIRGDVVYNLEVSDSAAHGGRFLPEIFAPPPLLDARGEIALAGGALGSGGLIVLRPSLLLDPSFGLELSAGASVARGGRLFMLMAGPVVNLFPHSPVVPFFTVAGGIVSSHPNADTFLLDAGSVTGLAAGVGLRIGFRYRITLRLEARSYVLFETDRYVREEEFSAGLTVFL